MEHTQVTSSHIAAIGYDQKEQLLEVIFTNGNTYQYKGVPVELHKSLMESPSKGAFLHRYIAPQFPAQKVAKQEAKQ